MLFRLYFRLLVLQLWDIVGFFSQLLALQGLTSNCLIKYFKTQSSKRTTISKRELNERTYRASDAQVSGGYNNKLKLPLSMEERGDYDSAEPITRTYTLV